MQWNGDVASLTALLGVKRTDAFETLMQPTGLDANAATDMLWQTYQPHLYVWIPMAAIGVLGMVSLIIFAQRAKRWKDMNV